VRFPTLHTCFKPDSYLATVIPFSYLVFVFERVHTGFIRCVRLGVSLMPSKVRASTSARGYGPAHQRMRVEYGRLVLAGRVRCARCGDWIVPGQEWDLGHTDDRRGYTGPEHETCNRGAAK